MKFRVLRAVAAVVLAAAALVVPLTPAQADQIRNDQWHLRFLNIGEAHRHGHGEGITVAVIDSGVDPHPDLQNNLLPGVDVVPGGTGDGRRDADGHGTSMGGLIAAHGRAEGSGALGIAPGTKILPVRDATPTNTGISDDLAEGIEWAVAHGAKVISISTGGGPSPRLGRAVEAARAADVVVVAAAGNRPKELVVTFPAFIDGVVAVGAVDRRGNRAEVSVTGDKLVLMAPGVDISSTGRRGSYRVGTGTSPATAIVAGAAALVRSKYPELSAEEVVHRLTATATDKGPPGRDDQYGFGVLNLVAALTADVPPLQPSGAPSPSPSPSTSNAATGPGPGTSSGSAGGAAVLVIAGLLIIGGGIVAVIVMLRRSAVKATPE